MGGSDKLGTLWDYEPHTAAKHRILRAYLDAWFPILASIKLAKRVVFIDGFAGPGEYSKGEEGSPAIAMRAAFEHKARFVVPVRLVFIEADAARHAHLCKVVARRQQSIAGAANLIQVLAPIAGDCTAILEKQLDLCASDRSEFGPALVFLDQFGYSDVPMALVQRILAHRHCEVFAYMHAEGMTRFLAQQAIHGAVSDAFGSDAWRRALTVRPSGRAHVLAEEYERALRERAGAKYVWRFAMHDSDGRLIYWLFFCTNSRKGLEVMKGAMLKVDTSGGHFSFSDARSPDQLLMFNPDPNWLASHLCQSLAGRDVSVEEIEEYVLTSTPLVACKRVLATLERERRIDIPSPPAARRKGAFTEPKMTIHFPKAPRREC